MADKTRAKSLAEQLADLEKPSKDFDPEAISDHGGESDSESDDEEKAIAGRAHYQTVGKSRLRKEDVAPLGPQYKGALVSRDAALEEDSDDPFSRGFGGDQSENESEDEVNGYLNGHSEDDDGEDDEDEDEDEDNEDQYESDEIMDGNEDDETPGTDISGIEDEQDSAEEEEFELNSGAEHKGPDRDELRNLMAEQQKSVTATLSLAAKADAEKGEAVKKQRIVFDSLLNTRIRLQKALQLTNSLKAGNGSTDDGTVLTDPAIEAAEAAAVRLWTSLNSLRESLQTTPAISKRKYSNYSEASEDQMWAQMQSYEQTSSLNRQSVLQKWSARSKNTAIVPNSRRLNASAEQTLVDVLNSQLSDMDRLVSRTRTPRSCAPWHIAQGIHESKDIYDDADFYGPLLKDLLEQRSQDNINGLNGLNFQSVAPWQAAREAKTKKVVDTRASKGRKMRFTIQEQIQNFMAAEDRGTWGDRQREELFAGLFGRRAVLDEDANGEAEDMEDTQDVSSDGFVLFGK